MATGISETTAQAEAMLALVEAARVALADEQIDIGFGFRTPETHRAWFYGVETNSDVEPAEVGPRRSLDERITLTVSLGTWAPFVNAETEAGTLTEAFRLLGLVQKHIRTTDITLGGTVLWCLPGSSESGTTSDEEAGVARLTEVRATFVCTHRITTA